MLDELYQDIILGAAKDATHRGTLSAVDGAINVRLNNPLCGDYLEVWLSYEDEQIKEVRFEGQGCLISQSSASLFVAEIQNLPLKEVDKLCKAFRKLVQTEPSEAELDSLGQLTALSGIRRLPSRARCALLSCEAVERLVRHALSNPRALSTPPQNQASLS